MANTLDINQMGISDMTNAVPNWDVTPKEVDGVRDQDETTWQNANWSRQWGYFNSIPDLKSAMLMKSVWNVGKGWTADSETTVTLEHISGWGKDTFDDILFNLDLISRIGGDSYAEIIKDAETGLLINLKPLNPNTMKIVIDRNGIIKRYEQMSTTKGAQPIKFKPEDILHISHNRLADQIHGISDIDVLEPIIKADQENFVDMQKIMHHQARPLIMFKLGTDKPATIAAFAAKMDSATAKGENVYIPDDASSVEFEVIQVNVSAIIMEWRTNLRNAFYRALGMPLIVFGNAGTTESGGKIEYMAHEQVFEYEQRKIEQQLWNQLFIRIDLIPPSSLVENMQANVNKSQGAFQPNDVMAGVGQ